MEVREPFSVLPDIKIHRENNKLLLSLSFENVELLTPPASGKIWGSVKLSGLTWKRGINKYTLVVNINNIMVFVWP